MSRASRETPHEQPELPPLHLLVPLGAQGIVAASPRGLMTANAFRVVLEPIFPPTEIERYAVRSGVDFRLASVLVYAQFEDGFLLLVQGPWDARAVVRSNGSRMTMVGTNLEQPFVRRGGFLGTTRLELIALRDDVILVANGAPQALAEVLARSLTRAWPPDSGAALETGDVAALAARALQAPLVVFAPEPLDLPADSGLGLVLAGETALRVAAVPEGPDQIRLSIDMRGEFPVGAEENLRTFFDSMAAQPMGRALGLREASPTLRISASADRVEARFTLASRALAGAAQIFFAPELRGILDASEP